MTIHNYCLGNINLPPLECSKVVLRNVNIDHSFNLNQCLEEIFRFFPKCEHLVIPETMAQFKFGDLERISAEHLKKVTIMYSKQTPIAIHVNLEYNLQFILPPCNVRRKPIKEDLDFECFQFATMKTPKTPLMDQLAKLYYQIEKDPLIPEIRKYELRYSYIMAIERQSIIELQSHIQSIIGNENSKEFLLETFKNNIRIYHEYMKLESAYDIDQFNKAQDLLKSAEQALLFNDYSPESLTKVSSTFNKLQTQCIQPMISQLEFKFDLIFEDLVSILEDKEEDCDQYLFDQLENVDVYFSAEEDDFNELVEV